MRRKTASYPVKKTMNLYYKPDRTTKPATAALYVLFVLVLLLGLSKVMVYDLWAEVRDARNSLSAAEGQLEDAMTSLADFAEVREEYLRRAPTEEELAAADRMEILALLDRAVGSAADMDSVSISGSGVQVRLSQVTLAQTAEIVMRLEESPVVESITVNTAAATGEAGDRGSASLQIQLKKGGGEA